jgi:hypothetical protein
MNKYFKTLLIVLYYSIFLLVFDIALSLVFGKIRLTARVMSWIVFYIALSNIKRALIKRRFRDFGW